MGKKTLVVGALVGAYFAIGCGGYIEASPDMTLGVAPSSINFTDTSNTVGTSTQRFVVSLVSSDGSPASGVVVYAHVDSFFVDTKINNQSVVSFPDCPNTDTCSCITNSNGRCTIRVSYLHGGGLEYRAPLVFYSGPLSEVVEITVRAQADQNQNP